MILTYDLILFFGVFVFCILVACIFRIIELSKQEKDWLPEITDEEAITGFSSSTTDEDDQQASRRSSPFPSFLLPSSMEEKERKSYNRFQEYISADSRCNITPNPLTHPYKKPAIPGSAVPFAASPSSLSSMQSIQSGRSSEPKSNHSARSKQTQMKQRSNQPVRSSESKQIAMRYFNVKSLDEIKDNETEPYVESIPKIKIKRHPGDVEQVGSKVQRQKVSENHQSAKKRQIYYNNNMIPSNDGSSSVSSSSETVYQSNQHEIGSVEAEFYNDFITIFPMRQLELRPDFNLLSKH